jgi:hypothetical protein
VAEATAESERLEALYTREVLARIVAAGGFDTTHVAEDPGGPGPAA